RAQFASTCCCILNANAIYFAIIAVSAAALGGSFARMQGVLADDIRARLQALRVLIVDDSAFMRKLVRSLLSGIGIRNVSEAADGIAALEKVRDAPPDLVILDWEMPFLNGFEFVRIVRTPGVFPHSDLPIIMLSGYCDRRNVVEAIRLGVN